MTNRLRNEPDLVQQELKTLADRVPEILSLGLVSVDGLTLGLYSKNPNAREEQIMLLAGRGFEDNVREVEDRFGPMAGAIVSLSERISMTLRAGEWDFSVIAGQNTKIFGSLVDDETVLIVIAKAVTSMDIFLPELKAACERLNAL